MWWGKKGEIMELHFWRMENLLKVVEALAKEKYNFEIESSPNGTWTVVLEESPEHCNQ
jgi:hypothetical protein